MTRRKHFPWSCKRCGTEFYWAWVETGENFRWEGPQFKWEPASRYGRVMEPADEPCEVCLAFLEEGLRTMDPALQQLFE